MGTGVNDPGWLAVAADALAAGASADATAVHARACPCEETLAFCGNAGASTGANWAGSAIDMSGDAVADTAVHALSATEEAAC
jgi:hypothetical protein